MEEIWKDIIGYEGLYRISNDGVVLSIARNGCGSKDKLTAITTNNCGYSTVLLSKLNERKRHLVHRLVAEAFLPNPEKKPDVNHKNGVKNYNHYANLEWCTKSENMMHAMNNGLKQEYGKGRPLTENHKLNLSSSLKGRRSPKGMLGKKWSVETRNKFSNTIKSRKDASE